MSESTNYDITLHPAGPCKHCGGAGKIVLLTSSRTCGFCCGSGKIGQVAEYYHSGDSKPKDLAGRVAMVQVGRCVCETTTYTSMAEC